MQCEIIQSKFGGRLIYVPSERMLYSYKITRNGQDIFECYQTTLRHKNKKDVSNIIPCTSRVRLLPNGMCERVNVYIPHTKHVHHEMIAADKKKVVNMKSTCRILQENVPGNAHRIPNRHIFQREVVK